MVILPWVRLGNGVRQRLAFFIGDSLFSQSYRAISSNFTREIEELRLEIEMVRKR